MHNNVVDPSHCGKALATPSCSHQNSQKPRYNTKKVPTLSHPMFLGPAKFGPLTIFSFSRQKLKLWRPILGVLQRHLGPNTHHDMGDHPRPLPLYFTNLKRTHPFFCRRLHGPSPILPGCHAISTFLSAALPAFRCPGPAFLVSTIVPLSATPASLEYFRPSSPYSYCTTPPYLSPPPPPRAPAPETPYSASSAPLPSPLQCRLSRAESDP